MKTLRFLSSYIKPLSVAAIVWGIVCIIDLQSGVKRIPAWTWLPILGSASLAVTADRWNQQRQAMALNLLSESSAYPVLASEVAQQLLSDSRTLIEAQRQTAGFEVNPEALILLSNEVPPVHHSYEPVANTGSSGSAPPEIINSYQSTEEEEDAWANSSSSSDSDAADPNDLPSDWASGIGSLR